MDKNTQKQVFDFLKKNYYGKENGKKAEEVAFELNRQTTILLTVEDKKRELREICNAINRNPDLGFISTSGSIYLCKTKEEVEKAERTAWRLAISCIKKAQAMSKKFGQQGQYEFSDDGQKIKILFEEEAE